uniref:L1 transposable element RRM domain-containing protein n=1 Tax=Maylandia zebra TaxID=106582 RepID=A0A3P9CPF9_9CICH
MTVVRGLRENNRGRQLVCLCISVKPSPLFSATLFSCSSHALKRQQPYSKKLSEHNLKTKAETSAPRQLSLCLFHCLRRLSSRVTSNVSDKRPSANPPREISALTSPVLCCAEFYSFAENLTSIRSDIQQLKTDLSSDITTMRQEFAGLRSTVTGMEQSLSTCTDDIVHLQAKVDAMSKELAKLENKCEDLESRSRRNNIRIVGVPEENVLSATDVSVLLMEAFQLGKEPLVDRAHRTLAPKPNTGERPRAVVVRLHYYADCARILQKARELQRVQINNMTISVFPDHTAKTARARAAFNEVRRQLRGIQGKQIFRLPIYSVIFRHGIALLLSSPPTLFSQMSNHGRNSYPLNPIRSQLYL